MKFKIGDRVRITREALSKQVEHSFVVSSEISGWEIKQIIGDKICCPNNKYWYEEKYLELVPEEPEFKCGEEIEVRDYCDKQWKKRIFISKIPGNVGVPYACVKRSQEYEYENGKPFDVDLWKTIRKLKPQLTRKEIAEKLGVSEDFIFVD